MASIRHLESSLPLPDRVRSLNEATFREPAKYVLYWSQMNLRTRSNHGLAYAADLANERGLPLLFYEGLTCSYPFANDRLHTFLLEGVPDTERELRKLGAGYLFYLRRKRSDPNDVLYKLAKDAAAVVSDDYPTFVARTHNERVPAKLDIPYFVVDSSCVVPMSKLEKREYAAYTIRPKITKMLPKYLVEVPKIRLRRRFDEPVSDLHTPVTSSSVSSLVASCEIDHAVAPSMSFRGGWSQARKHLDHFLTNKLRTYASDRNEPSKHATSGLSPYLHFGHISSLAVALTAKAYALEHKLFADEYLEELIVRRELAFNFARFTDDLTSLSNLPEWARKMLEKHAADPRDPVYTTEQFEQARTYDDLWNATQKELLLRGKIHGYYRMYWGKKILEWSATPQSAVDTMVYL
ncbi:MAG: deoxyribodipyrimidine photo-lyase, partial [Acidobacteriota bacterium]|nr:deoxyribodipyrimidine photo-lyase [Acidobacteriota bacterium]